MKKIEFGDVLLALMVILIVAMLWMCKDMPFGRITQEDVEQLEELYYEQLNNNF